MKQYLLATVTLCSLSVSGQRVKISGQLPEPADSIIVLVWDHIFSESKRMVTPYRTFSAPYGSGTFAIGLDSINGPVYYSLYSKNTRSKLKEELKLYLAEPGDSININIKNKTEMHVGGTGYAKYAFRFRSDTLTDYLENRFPYDRSLHTDFKNKNYLDYLRKSFNQIDTFLNKQLALLAEYQAPLSAPALLQLKADILGKSIEKKYGCFALVERYISSQDIANDGQRNLALMYAMLEQSVNSSSIKIPDPHLLASKDYAKGILLMTMAAQKQKDTGTLCHTIEQTFQSAWRDKLLALYLIENFDFIPDADSVLADALQVIETSWDKEPLYKIQNRLSKGAPAYNFVLEDTSGKYRTLSEFKGKKVFLDFWYTGCTGCVQLYKNTLAPIEEILSKDTSVVFISISIDTDKETWLRSIEGGNYTSSNNINLRTGDAGSNHPIINRYNVSFFPKTFLLDKNGLMYRNTTNIRDKNEILSVFRQASQQ